MPTPTAAKPAKGGWKPAKGGWHRSTASMPPRAQRKSSPQNHTDQSLTLFGAMHLGPAPWSRTLVPS